MDRARLATLYRNTKAVAAIEFALLAPVFFLFVMGAFDFCYQVYGKSVLTGAVEEASRMATLERNMKDPTILDEHVASIVKDANRDATLTFARQSYKDFNDVGYGEEYTDDNGNGARDDTECYEDVNGNRRWDADKGTDGNGGARDVVAYTVTMTYDRLFPLWSMMGQPQEKTLTVQTVLRNQPFAAQQQTTEVICQ